MAFKDALKRARLAARLTQDELAAAAGYPTQSRIANYESGRREPTLDDIGLLAEILGVSVSELTDAGAPRDQAREDLGWNDVLGYAQSAGLGDGVEAAEYAETHKLKFRADSLSRKRLVASQLAVMYGRGDSMLPRIHDGDAILFDTGDIAPSDERLFVIAVVGVARNEYSVKRCRVFGDDVYFDALNPSGDHNWRKPKKLDDKRNPISIVGRVRWIGSWED